MGKGKRGGKESKGKARKKMKKDGKISQEEVRKGKSEGFEGLKGR